LTRQSIIFAKKLLANWMDPRVKPAGDAGGSASQRQNDRNALLVAASAVLRFSASLRDYVRLTRLRRRLDDLRTNELADEFLVKWSTA
jgi:hypothetical protein